MGVFRPRLDPPEAVVIPGACVHGSSQTYGRTFPARALDPRGSEFHGPQVRALVLCVMPVGSSAAIGETWTLLLIADGRLRWALDEDGWEPAP